MTKTTYLYYVVEKYISLSTACIFAMENYLQKTSADGYAELRKQFAAWMEIYDKMYVECETWPRSKEDLIDKTVLTYLDSEVDRAVSVFLQALAARIPVPLAGGDKIDLVKMWEDVSQGKDKPSAIYALLREVRQWEEASIY